MKTKHPHRSGYALPETGPVPPPAAALTQPTPARQFQIKRVLVPVDFSAGSVAALDYALAMAKALQASVIALHVVEPAAQASLNVGGGLDPANQRLLERAQERLRQVSATRAGQGAAVETLVRMGHAPSEIADTAKAMAVDWIVLARHGHDPRHPVTGSTVERVARVAPCPVLTVPPTEGAGHGA